MAQSRGWQGAVLKVLGADDYTFTVTSREEITPHYLRLGVHLGGLLADRAPHPTMWVRGWFPLGEGGEGKVHQRGYTLVRPDATTGTAFLDFAIHDGAAVTWAQGAALGDTLLVTLLGSKFDLPEPAPLGWLLVGDPASIPAINSLLAIAGDAPARVWLEYRHDGEREIPVDTRPQDEVTWVAAGELAAAVRAAAFDATGWYGFVAAEFRATRASAAVLRADYALGRKGVHAQAYWK